MDDPVARLMNLRVQSGTVAEADRAPARCVVRPLGLLGGAAAAAAVDAGLARWLAGGPLAFTAAEVSEGEGKDIDVEVRQVRDLGRLKDSLVATRLDEISVPRAPLGGLSWARTRVAAILDLSTEMARETKLAVARGRMMAREGADMIAVTMRTEGRAAGGEEAERQRLVPVVEELTGQGIRVAAFSRYAETMQSAADAGARFLADTGSLEDGEMLHVVSGLGLPLMIRPMLPRGQELDADKAVVAVYQSLEQAVEICQGSGIARGRLIVDPGVGSFGDAATDMALLNGMSAFHGLGCPLALGAERSGLVASITGEPDAQRRLPGEVVLASEAMAQGVHILFANNVSEAWQTAVARRALASGQVGEIR